MKLISSIKKNLSPLGLILILSPIVDVLIAYIQINYNGLAILGSAIRGILLLFVLFYTFIFKKENNSLITNYIIGIILFILFFVVYKRFMQTEIVGIIKFFFFPLVLLSFLICEQNEDKITKSLYISAITYMLLLIIPMITNTAYDSYSYNKAGFTGWFYSPNEISSIVSLLTPFIIIKPLSENSNKKKIIYTIIAIIYISTIFTLGTKTPIFATFITLIFFVIMNFIKILSKNDKLKSNIINLFIILLISVCSIYEFKNGIALDNVILQSNRFENVENNTQGQINVPGDNKPNKNDNKPNKNEEITSPSNEEIDKNEIKENNKDKQYKTSKLLNLIFSSRDVYLVERFENWKDQPLKSKLLGTGQLEIQNNSTVHKLIEIDVFDIFFSYGIIGFLIYYMPILYIIFILIKHLIKKPKLLINNYLHWAYYISIALGILISSIAGHVLGAPAVSLILAIIVSSINIYEIKQKQYKFFTLKRITTIGILMIAVTALALCLAI